MAIHEDSFHRFLARHASDFKRISRATRGEETVEGVLSEAWMLIHELAAKGEKVDLNSSEGCDLVLAHLYQKLVRYTELTVRHAVRLDHAAAGDDEGASHPLMNRLAADEQYDPINVLLHQEDEAACDSDAALHPGRSLAGAYLDLLGRLGNEMSRVAEHLMISLSYCYQRCAHARTLAVYQQGLPESSVRADERFMPGPWRRYRIVTSPEQLCFDFEEDRSLLL